jgi:hypothetical protein
MAFNNVRFIDDNIAKLGCANMRRVREGAIRGYCLGRSRAFHRADFLFTVLKIACLICAAALLLITRRTVRACGTRGRCLVRRSWRDIGQELSDVQRGERTQVPSCVVGSSARLDFCRCRSAL